MKKYFDRGDKRDTEKAQVDTTPEGKLTREQMYDPARLAQIISKSRLFKQPSKADFQQIQQLPAEKRMAYILSRLAREKSHIKFPRPKEYKQISRLHEAALKNLNKHLNSQNLKTQSGAAAHRRLTESITTMSEWLQTPAIYDNRASHEARRAWRIQMIALFDKGKGRNAQGPFSDFYHKNIISPNFSMPVLQTQIQANLKLLGLEHPSTNSDFESLKQLSRKLSLFPSESISERVRLVLEQIRPIVLRILTKLARREYIQVEVSEKGQGGLTKGSVQEPEVPDWLQDQMDRDDLDWDQIFGK